MRKRPLRNFLKGKKKEHVIIFVHGLSNKPPKELLRQWYIDSIWEGLKMADLKVDAFSLEVVYWADLMYPKPLDPMIKDKKHPLYLDEPYVPFDGKYQRTTHNKRNTFIDKFERWLESLFLKKQPWINLDYVFDIVTRRIVKDLYIYYRQNIKGEDNVEELARQVIRRRLVRKLKRNKYKKVMLISHSMGSIIAYDVLTHVLPDIKIDMFVTIGSPLGLPMIKREIFKELQLQFDSEKRLPTPENVIGAWYNLSDPRDAISADSRLMDDYSPNSLGVGPQDIAIVNTYQMNGVANVHKSFGYLRA
ncbi:MAG: hypothetical protein AAFO69_11900, partial [Bacteroidota bacterium]